MTQPQQFAKGYFPQRRDAITYAFPQSFAQERLWFLDQLRPGVPAYNVVARVALSHGLAVESLKRAVDGVVARHEALRTTFCLVEGLPTQVVHPAESVAMAVVDLSDAPRERRDAEIERAVAAEHQHVFDLGKGPLVRAALFRISSCECELLLNMHHIVADAWSLGIMLSEMAALYQAFIQGLPCLLQEPELQYADFAQWQREWLRDDVLARLLSYWEQQLRGGARFNRPPDGPPSAKFPKLPRRGAAFLGA